MACNIVIIDAKHFEDKILYNLQDNIIYLRNFSIPLRDELSPLKDLAFVAAGAAAVSPLVSMSAYNCASSDVFSLLFLSGLISGLVGS